MSRLFGVLTLIVATLSTCSAGVVSPVYRCGGTGTQLQFRISGCEGHCNLLPGVVYNCENDFMPNSASSSLSLWVEICYLNNCSIIVRAALPNSAVQPGLVYTVKFDIVPGDAILGEVELREYIYHTDSMVMEVCVGTNATVAA